MTGTATHRSPTRATIRPVTATPARVLGTGDAVVLGLGAILGTGVFTVLGPAAAAAGGWLVPALGVAAVVATCNAASSADLAAAHPVSGGAYVYGGAEIGPWAGRLAGCAFLVGKTASAAAAAGVLGAYLLPAAPGAAAVAAVVVVTALNLGGVRWTVRVTRMLVAVVLAVLAVVVVTTLATALPPVEVVAAPVDVRGVAQGAALLFFAFAGYARIATLGGEVRDPRRTLPRAVLTALAITLAVYLLVTLAVQAQLGAALAASTTPLLDAVAGSAVTPVVRVGAVVATASVLLSVLVGVSRTAAAMAAGGDLPGSLARLGSRGTPWRADLLGGVVAAGLAVAAGPAAAIALSACSVLVYYAVANAAALRLRAEQRRFPAWTGALGLVLCVGLAAVLPGAQVAATVVVVGVATMVCGTFARPAR